MTLLPMPSTGLSPEGAAQRALGVKSVPFGSVPGFTARTSGTTHASRLVFVSSVPFVANTPLTAGQWPQKHKDHKKENPSQPPIPHSVPLPNLSASGGFRAQPYPIGFNCRRTHSLSLAPSPVKHPLCATPRPPRLCVQRKAQKYGKPPCISNTQPAPSPVNACRRASRQNRHDSGPV